jgi:hypothetical protein
MMTIDPGTTAPHRLLTAYLADLDRALLAVDPQERADTLASVREHVADALAGAVDPTDEQVRRIVDELGPVERIAAACTPAVPGPPPDGGQWVGPALFISSVVSLALVVIVPWLAITIAAVCLVVTLIRLRRPGGPRALLRAAAVLSAVTLLATLAAAAFFLSSESTDGPATSGVQTAEPQHT